MGVSPYRIIHSPNGDWYVAAKRNGRDVVTLYVGDCLAKAKGAILRDAGIDALGVVRDVSEEGTYFPKLRDWKE